MSAQTSGQKLEAKITQNDKLKQTDKGGSRRGVEVTLVSV